MPFTSSTLTVLITIIGCKIFEAELANTIDGISSVDYTNQLITETQGVPKDFDNWDDDIIQPFFDNSTKGYVKAQSGTTVKLYCTVHQLGNRDVSWVRKSDYHILTVSDYTYTGDGRFKSTHHKESGRWTLEIGKAQKSDSGIYECQVSSDPKISKEIQVDILAAKTNIIGSNELYIRRGSSVNITCHITDGDIEFPMFVIWYHNREIIDQNFPPNGVTIWTKTILTTTSSVLNIERINNQHSGIYTCKPSYSKPVSILLHLARDEEAAAMQFGGQQSVQSCIYAIIVSTTGIFISNLLTMR